MRKSSPSHTQSPNTHHKSSVLSGAHRAHSNPNKTDTESGNPEANRRLDAGSANKPHTENDWKAFSSDIYTQTLNEDTSLKEYQVKGTISLKFSAKLTEDYLLKVEDLKERKIAEIQTELTQVEDSLERIAPCI